MPALFSFYSFSRTLFDAAVACAHNVIKDPNSVWVHTAFEDVSYALEVLRDPMLNTARGPMRGGVEGGVPEAIKVVELLQRKAESARHGGSNTTSAGTKRKHDEVEADVEHLRHGFRFPFVSAPVVSTNVPMPTADSAAPLSATATRPAAAPPGFPSDQQAQTAKRGSPVEEQSKRTSSAAPKHGSDHSKSKDRHAKKPPYPQTGIRVRTEKDPSPFTKVCMPPATPAPPSADSDPPPARQVSSIATSPGVEHPPYSQQSTSFPPASQSMSLHHTSASQKLDGGSVDFLVPFGTGDEAVQAQINIDVSQTRRYCQTEMSQDVSSSQQVAKVSPAVATLERPHSGPFPGSSPASYAPSSGSYSNINSPYTNGGTQFSTTPSHEQQSSSFDMSAPTQSYYPYDPQTQTHSMSLVGVNHGGDDLSFQLRDQAVSQNSGLFQYQHDKPHQGMYTSERHVSVPQSPFMEQHAQSIAQAWTPQAGAIPEENGFWRSYDPFTA